MKPSKQLIAAARRAIRDEIWSASIGDAEHEEMHEYWGLLCMQDCDFRAGHEGFTTPHERTTALCMASAIAASEGR